MDLRLSVVAPGARAPVDVRVSVPAGSRLGSVAGHLRAAAGVDGSLYVAGVLLGDETQLGAPPLVHGALVTVGDPGRRQRPRGLLQLRVVGGPDAGAIHHVDPGVVRVGRAIGNDIRLDDPDVSRTHAELTIGWDSVGVRDLGSTNGTTVWGRRVSDEVIPLPLGAALRVGASTLVLARPVLSPTATHSDGVGRLEFNRPPRIRHHKEGTEISLPAEPRVRERTRFPLVALLLPLVLAGVLLAVFRRPEFVVFAALSPLLLGGQWVGDRLVHRRDARGAWAEYERAVATTRARLAAAVAEESATARAQAPDLAEVLATVALPTSTLWHRRPGDADWLLVRLGTADQPSTVRIRSPTPEGVAAVDPPMLPDAPVTVALHEVGVLGLAGARHRVLGLARAMVAQLAVLHSPRDLLLVLLAPGERAADWAWAGWLPHLTPSHGQDCAALVGLDPTQGATRVCELSALVEARREAAPDRAPWPGPYTVLVLDGARALRSIPGVARLLANGPGVGVHAICLDERAEDLPAECRARAVVQGESCTTLRAEVDGFAPVTDGIVDAASLRWAERVARTLAPLRDATPDDTGAGRLPDTVRWLDLVVGQTAAGLPTADVVAARWRASPRSTSALIGVGADGRFTVDLRRDGPHALVAGTTGSGKSELLQTLVVSLALANRPDEMCFVLIDYKGGAAFAECARLPHLAGLVTNLDGHLTRRALASLDAELKRREQVLGSLGAADLDAFHATRAPGAPPMPRLVIVVDEFAALVEELPDFVRGLVGVAQRGRSLGVHLVLATQRPAGVVSSEIRANTGLRIALRVNDAAESDDVVGCRGAASIPRRLPGRALARAGAEPAVAFQTARVAGRGVRAREPLVEAAPWSGLGDPLPRTGDAADDGPSDLARVVAVLTEASALLDVPPVPSPWLPPLPDQVSVRSLRVAPASGGRLPPLPYGVLDVPAEQARRTLALDLQHGGHLVVAGGPRSGRSTLLRTVALQVAQHCCASDVHLYGIDAGDGALLPLTALPQCGAVVAVDQVERVARLLDRLGDEIRRRQAILARAGHADATEQRSHAPPEERLPYLLVLLDRWEGFLTALDDVDAGRLTEAVLGLARDGLGVGLRMVVTGDRSVLLGRVASLVEDTLVLRMPVRADAALAGLQLRDLPDRQGPGRAVLAPAGLAAQLALPGDDASGPGQVTRLRRVGAAASLRDAAVPAHLRPFRIAALPDVVAFDRSLIPARATGLWALVGIGGDEAGPTGVDLGADSGPAFVVGGPPRSGRSTALAVVAVSVLGTGGQVVLVAPRRSPLRRLAGRSGVLAVLTGVAGDEARLQTALVAATAPLVVLVDDAEVVVDSALGAVLDDYLSSCRDGDRALVLAGMTTDLQAGFRGVAAEARKGRTGLLLSPQGALDGDLLGVRLPRSHAMPGPRGRGVLVVRGALTAVQVPFLDPAAEG